MAACTDGLGEPCRQRCCRVVLFLLEIPPLAVLVWDQTATARPSVEGDGAVAFGKRVPFFNKTKNG